MDALLFVGYSAAMPIVYRIDLNIDQAVAMPEHPG